MLTPSGRFRVGSDICLSASSFHPETWSARWSLTALVRALKVHMVTDAREVGGVECGEGERRLYAVRSREFVLRGKGDKGRKERKKGKEKGKGKKGKLVEQIIVDHRELLEGGWLRFDEVQGKGTGKEKTEKRGTKGRNDADTLGNNNNNNNNNTNTARDFIDSVDLDDVFGPGFSSGLSDAAAAASALPTTPSSSSASTSVVPSPTTTTPVSPHSHDTDGVVGTTSADDDDAVDSGGGGVGVGVSVGVVKGVGKNGGCVGVTSSTESEWSGSEPEEEEEEEEEGEKAKEALRIRRSRKSGGAVVVVRMAVSVVVRAVMLAFVLRLLRGVS